MKTTLGGPRDVRVQLDSSLQELQQKKTNLEAEVAKVEARDVRAEAQAQLAESKFKLKDLLPGRWKRIFVKRETFDSILDRLSKSREADVTRARTELKKLDDVTAPFRALSAQLAQLDPGVAVDELGLAGVTAQQTKHEAALQQVDTLAKALDAAGTCEATASFPFAQLDALKTALSGDLGALKTQLEAENKKISKALAEAVEAQRLAAEKAAAEKAAAEQAAAEQAAAARAAAEKAAAQQKPVVQAPAPEPVVQKQQVLEQPVVQAPALEQRQGAEPKEPAVQSFRERRLAHAGQVAKDDDQVRNGAPVAPAKPKVADKQGPLSHLGQPVQFGAEKETNMKTMSAGDKLAPTEVQGFDRSLLRDKLTPDMLNEASRGKTADNVAWSDLNDKGKSAYSLAYSAKYTQDPSKPKWPIIKATPQANFSAVDFEPNGWIEVISSKFDTIKDANVFLSKFGWGHIHTTWVRGAKPEVQLQQATWMRNANLWMFLDALESRGASSGGESFWRFAIKGLSIPTEDHLKLALEMIRGRNMTATAFSKHLHIGLRASGKYGPNRDRIGFEARGGVEDQKKRVLDSLLNGLCQETWGSHPAKYGEEEFKLVTVGDTSHQVNSLPREFQTLISKHLEKHAVGNLTAGDAGRLYNLVAGATFYDGRTPAARLNAFDQRGCTPLLEFEKLSWLTDAEKARVVEARGRFIQSLADLDAKKGGMRPSQLGAEVTSLMERWAKDARLAEPFGRWLDGGDRQRFFS